MAAIDICFPTRNRPQSVVRCIESIYTTALNPDDISIFMYLDADDTTTPAAIAAMAGKYPGRINARVGSRITLSDTYNKVYPCTTADILYVFADDVVMRTHGWDKMVRDKFDAVPDRIAMVHGDDLNNPHLATHMALHRRWIDILGYMTPPYFAADYADTWINDIAKCLERRYRLPYIAEHLHFSCGKSAVDSTYKEARERAQHTNPERSYMMKTPERMRDTDKLKAAMQAACIPCI